MLLTDSGAGVTALSSAAGVTTTATIVDECSRVPDGSAVVASLRSKHVHCIDVQHSHVEDFASWFEHVVLTQAFVSSIDRWT